MFFMIFNFDAISIWSFWLKDYIEKHGEEDFKNFLDQELGGWPILSDNYDVSKFIFHLKNYNVIEFDFNNSIIFFSYLLCLLLTCKHDRFNSYFDKDDFENQTLIKEYSNYIKSFVLLLKPNLNSSTLDDDIESIIDLEKHYASFVIR